MLKASTPKLVSTQILRTLEDTLVAKQICNMETKSEIKKFGDTVYFTGLADPTVKKYEGTITYEKLKDGSVALKIDQRDYVAFTIDDIEDFQSKIDAKNSQITRASYKTKKATDEYVLGLYAQAGHKIDASAGISSANVLSVTSDIMEQLDEVNVIEGDRFMVIPSWLKQKYILAGVKFQINNGMDGQKGGLAFGEYQGTKILVSNNLTKVGDVYKVLAGSYNAIVFADQIMKSRIIEEMENSFEASFSSLHVYGARVIKPEELVCIDAKKLAETTI